MSIIYVCKQEKNLQGLIGDKIQPTQLTSGSLLIMKQLL